HRAVGAFELEMRARHRDKVLGPEAPDRLEPLLEAFAEPLVRHAKRLELDLAVADAAAKDEFAAGHDVERRQLLGQVERLVQRQQYEAADQPQPRRDRRDMGEKRDLLKIFERVGAVMRALDDAVKPEFVGAPYQGEVIRQMADDVARQVLA